MQNTFYIVKHSDTCWNLRVKDIHFTMSAKSSKEEILECLHKVVLRYRTKKHLLHVLSNLSTQQHLSKEQTQQRVNEELESILYMEDVQEVVSRALKEVAMDNDIVRNRKRIKVNTTLVDVEVNEVEEVEEELPVVPKKILKRIKVNKVVLPVEEE